MIVKVDKDGFVPIEPFIKLMPALKNAVYYKFFPKKGYLVIRFYDKAGKWIRV